ncbi:hypothetical protein P9847_01430 [Paenibacillus chibensis]|uniref:Uncharacterized protein n=1 Tax=Paenibacillus chibensis TaxID=59846 RepID=A0ABU6PM78_9BACL|nr:hypothetical protein [Paenibacillus chibensis]
MKRKGLIFTRAFYDKYTGEYLGDDPKEVFAKLPPERLAWLKALTMEMITGIPHKPVYGPSSQVDES